MFGKSLQKENMIGGKSADVTKGKTGPFGKKKVAGTSKGKLSAMLAGKK
jgi:hypothetical protein